jgi:hypothetical protein
VGDTSSQYEYFTSRPALRPLVASPNEAFKKPRNDQNPSNPESRPERSAPGSGIALKIESGPGIPRLNELKGGIRVTLSLGKIVSESIVFIIENQFLNDSDPMYGRNCMGL